ncbi:MAG TPA: hypothetical protein VGK48_25165 [Terriglobia bacterium]|jgi:hypothetical protein
MSANVLRDHYLCPQSYILDIPFDADQVIDNLRMERYASTKPGSSLCHQIARKIYYGLRPLMGVGIRKHIQRAYLNGWKDLTFPHWPVDRTVESILESLVMLSIETGSLKAMPFAWFWPWGSSGCLIMTHDIETATGRDFAPKLADIDASFGFTPSFQVVPEERYEVTEDFLDSLRARRCEINLHGLNHDDRLFENRQAFRHRAAKINGYARRYGAAGFRSPVLYRVLDWFDEFDFSYDMSVPNCGHLDPQRGGCCTVMPYFIGNILELPLTMSQDYSIFHFLRQHSIDLWKRQIDLVLEKHGLISFNVHPDYIIEEPYLSLYHKLLEHLARVREERNVWSAFPNQVNQWWRERRNRPEVNARARIEKGRLVYEIAGSADLGLRSAEWQTFAQHAA